MNRWSNLEDIMMKQFFNPFLRQGDVMMEQFFNPFLRQGDVMMEQFCNPFLRQGDVMMELPSERLLTICVRLHMEVIEGLPQKVMALSVFRDSFLPRDRSPR